MPGYVRKVKTGSGAIAVQIVEKRGGVRRIVEHVGSAHTDLSLCKSGQTIADYSHEHGLTRRPADAKPSSPPARSTWGMARSTAACSGSLVR